MGISRNTLNGTVTAGVAALMTLLAAGAPARAVVISVDGVNWNITSTEVPADTDFNVFKATYITSQPWNGSQTIATKFATALGGQLNFPNDGVDGPFFAYLGELDPGGSTSTYTAATGVSNGSGGISGVLTFELSSADTWTYATATREPSSVVPGPLPVLGGMAAFGWSRRLRRRVTLVTRP